jgi:murein DD-endopeptidase MepM/ murein hydrolase activator NlpD
MLALFRVHKWTILAAVLGTVVVAAALRASASAVPVEPIPVVMRLPTMNIEGRFPEPPPKESLKPDEWMPKLRRCQRKGKRYFCDGPRRVPVPEGQAAERAETLGLGTARTASQIIVRKPEPEWVRAVDGDVERSLLWPVPEGRQGRGFGYVRKSLPDVRHDGVDIPAEIGSHVRATNDGIVAYSDNGVSGYGNLVLLVHGDGTATLYAHLHAAYVFAGQQVDRGQVIGEVGSTGLSRGPHLHFEWHVGGRPRDPASWFVDEPDSGGHS